MTTLRLPDGSVLALPAIERLLIRLRLTESTRFHLRHEPVLHGLLCQIFGHDLPEVMPAAVQSGRVVFGAGDSYVFGLTAVGNAVDAIPGALERLQALGRRSGSNTEGRTLWGNFAVDAVTHLGPPDLTGVEADARTLGARGVATLQFLSPLELRRPRPRGSRHRPKGHFNPSFFPADAFLARCWRRFADLRAGKPAPGAVPTIPASVRADPSELLWLDIPTRGRPEGKAGRPHGQIKGGVMGAVTLAGLTPDWCNLLALLRHFHVGQSVRYGFGRYSLVGTRGEDEPFRLASDLQEELRWLVDGLALSLLRRREARQEDFEQRPDGAVWMSHELRRRDLEVCERRLLDTLTPEGGEAISYRGFLFEQAVAWREIARGRLDTDRPLVRPA